MSQTPEILLCDKQNEHLIIESRNRKTSFQKFALLISMGKLAFKSFESHDLRKAMHCRLLGKYDFPSLAS